MIYAKNKLREEIDFAKILLYNGHPEDMAPEHILKKIAQFSTAKPFGPGKCPLYLRAQRIGSAFQQLEYHIKTAVRNCYGAVSPWLIFSNQCMLRAAKNNLPPANQKSMVIYE